MKNRKRYALIGVGAAIAGIFFGLLGFYFLEKEGLDYVFSVYLALAGICLIAELVMLIKSGHLQEKELEEWCASLTAVMLPPLSRDFVLETFQNHGFRFLDSEIFMKKPFGGWVMFLAMSAGCLHSVTPKKHFRKHSALRWTV